MTIKAGLGFLPSASLYRHLESGGDKGRVIRAAYQVSEAYSGCRQIKVPFKTCDLYAVLKKMALFIPAAVGIFYRNTEFYDQSTVPWALEVVHTPVIDVKISKPAEVTDGKLSAYAAAILAYAAAILFLGPGIGIRRDYLFRLAGGCHRQAAPGRHIVFAGGKGDLNGTN